MARRESGASRIRNITLETKQTGAPSAGNLHAGCDVAGAGDGFTVGLVRHSQRKRGEQIGRTYGTPRQSSTRPLRTIEPQQPGESGTARRWKSPAGVTPTTCL